MPRFTSARSNDSGFSTIPASVAAAMPRFTSARSNDSGFSTKAGLPAAATPTSKSM